MFAIFGVASGSRPTALHDKMGEIYDEYDEHFKSGFDYQNYIKTRNSDGEEMDRINKFKKYGFADVEKRNYSSTREFNADDYISYIQTHSTHIALKEPYKTNFYAAVRDVILSFGDKAVLNDDIILHIGKKP